MSKVGVNIVIYANQLLRSAYPAMLETAKSILTHKRSYESRDNCISIKEILELIPLIQIKLFMILFISGHHHFLKKVLVFLQEYLIHYLKISALIFQIMHQKIDILLLLTKGLLLD